MGRSPPSSLAREPLSRGPVIDPNHVPFTYVTEAVGYTVRDGSLVEVAFTAEHVADADANEPPARVIEARLAMPMATAAGVADILGRIADRQRHEHEEDIAEASPVDPAAISHGVILAGLDYVVRELIDHSVAVEDRGAMLDWLRDRLQRELRKADIEGVAATEGPAVEHAVGVLDQMFERWREVPTADAV